MVEGAIESAFTQFSHPLLVPVLMAEVTTRDLMRKLLGVHDDLTEFEVRTGFGDWGQQAAGGNTGGTTFRRLSHDLGTLGHRFLFLEVAVQCTLEMNELTLQKLNLMKNLIPEPRLKSLEGAAARLRERAEFLSNNLKHMRLFGGLSKRLQAQQNIVSSYTDSAAIPADGMLNESPQLFNLVSQQDADLNIALAHDSKKLAAASKRDSSAMKIIAILTTIFLPGTFISVSSKSR
jgi:hypothetical protein